MNTKKKLEEKLNYNQKRVIVSIGDFINGGDVYGDNRSCLLSMRSK